ncbi:MAG: ATP-binding protein [Saprospiraceae bacterium]|nr:ATP-binding protein [Saprospiraceae bacterium]
MKIFFISTIWSQSLKFDDFDLYNQQLNKIDRSISGIFQDKWGFMWITGTENIYRFDGLNFTSILDLKDENFDFPQITAGRNDIVQDHKDRYWFLTHTALVRWDPSQPIQHAWKKYGPNQTDHIPLPTNRMHRLALDAKGFIWVVFDGGDLYKINPENGQAIQRVDFRIKEAGLRRSEIDAMEYHKEDNRIYFGGDYLRLIAVNPDNGKIEYPHIPLRSILKKAGIYEEISKHSITDFVKDSTDWWLGLSNNVILRYSFLTGNYKLIGRDVKHNKMVVSRMKMSPTGDVYYADVNEGLQIIDAKKNEISPAFSRQFAGNTDLGNVLDIFFDKTGALWLASGKCLAKYDAAEHLFKPYAPYAANENEISHFYYEDPFENEFIGTNKGLFFKNKSENVFNKIPVKSTNNAQIDVISMLFWYKNHYLIGTSQGVFHFDLDQKTIRKLPVRGDKKSIRYYSENPAHTILLDTIDNVPIIWFASKLRFLYQYNPQTKIIKAILPNQNDPAAYPHQVIQNIKKSPDGTLWLGTAGGGLSQMTDKQKFIFKTWQNHEFDSLSIQNNYITDLSEIDDGKIWISTITGIDLLDHGKFHHLSAIPGTSRYVSALASGKNHELWSVTEKEIIQWSPQSKALFAYPKGKYDFNSLFVKHSGDLILWESKLDQFSDFTSNNIYLFKNTPDNLKFSTPTTRLTYFGVGKSDSSHMLLKINNQLSHNQNNISFTFACLSYTLSKANRFMWKLDGVDESWINPGNNTNFTNYSGLNPGTYTFYVKSCNADGIWDNIGTTCTFEVLSSWYQTWWFKIIVLLLSSIILWYLFHQRTLRLLAYQRVEIEKSLAIENERKRIARDMHDEVGSGLSAIHLYSVYLKNEKLKDFPFISSDLDKIVKSSDELNQKVKEIIWSNEISEPTTGTLINFIKQYLEELNGIHSVSIHINDDKFTENVNLTPTAHKNIYLCVKEAINNAIKYSQASNIDVTFTSQNEHISIEIRDNGKGFDISSAINFGGNGLKNIYSRIHEIGGSVSINSDNTGTAVTLSI